MLSATRHTIVRDRHTGRQKTDTVRHFVTVHITKSDKGVMPQLENQLVQQNVVKIQEIADSFHRKNYICLPNAVHILSVHRVSNAGLCHSGSLKFRLLSRTLGACYVNVVGGGLGNTRRGGQDENTKYSGRDDFTSRER